MAKDKPPPSESKTLRYVAFLRGINVSGQKLIKMVELAKMFEGMKLEKVKTYIQSGNVLFESREKNADKLCSAIEKALEKTLGYEVSVLLRTESEMKKLIKLDPFATLGDGKEVKFYVSFLNDRPRNIPDMPFFSVKKDVEVIGMEGSSVFCLSHSVKGQYGFPNAFLEKTFKVIGTTRNWNTVLKVSGMF